jgi:hypothetical protein
VTAYPRLYDEFHSGCSLPEIGFGPHGDPVVAQDITFTIEISGQLETTWKAGAVYTLKVSAFSSELVNAWVHASEGALEAVEDGGQSSACSNAWWSTRPNEEEHQLRWVASTDVPVEGRCVVFSTAQAAGSTAAYQTNSVRIRFHVMCRWQPFCYCKQHANTYSL